ncbi:2Fe-2S iron-sulfur cluster-binding protein [Acidocella aromatica]|uniref:Ferredoxin/truncated hemoglobin YjbI n=1 Tax=Acidocella aromatica TaxID=1303579 RepID=A0A840VSQ4_9PROT|nr:ferredoxin/truncated hemoglobin YjbI [Acidocella aromatica]
MTETHAPVVTYMGRSVAVRTNETVLNALLRAGIEVPFSCKAGSCQTCLLKCLEGELPERTQRGLSETLRAKSYFMPCRCKPAGDMQLAPVNADDLLAEKASAAPTESEIPYPETDPALWMELQQDGDKVRKILEAFYDMVYADEQLAPFFENVQKEHVTDKQYVFMKRCLLGEKVYFGNRPRNAHHWMIISDELMDHRQALMLKSLRANGLTQDQIDRWVRFEEHFRGDIVKQETWPKRMGGQDIVFEGVGQEVFPIALICDYCHAEIPAGTTVVVHHRRGLVSCPACASGAPLT